VGRIYEKPGCGPWAGTSWILLSNTIIIFLSNQFNN
jgi:hypothetical protein